MTECNLKPIRILHVNINMNRGGIETFIMNLYRHIDKSKIQFDFLLHTDKKSHYEDEITYLGGKIFRVKNPINNGLPSIYRMIKYRQELSAFFKKHKYRIIHTHISGRSADALLIAKKHGVAVRIAHSHVAWKQINFHRLLYEIKNIQVRSLATQYLACSTLAAISLFGKKIFNQGKVRIINNAIDIEKFQFNPDIRKEIRKKYGLEDKILIGNVARFNQEKNHSFLLNIFNELVKNNQNYFLMLVGDGNLKDRIIKKVSQYGLESKVLLLGFRNDVEKLLQAMDIFVFPSFYEGLGIVLIEAQVAGLPCIVSDRIPKEAFISKRIVKLSLSLKSKKWAKKVDEVFKTYSRGNNKLKVQHFDIQKVVKWFENYYLCQYILNE